MILPHQNQKYSNKEINYEKGFSNKKEHCEYNFKDNNYSSLINSSENIKHVSVVSRQHINDKNNLLYNTTEEINNTNNETLKIKNIMIDHNTQLDTFHINNPISIKTITDKINTKSLTKMSSFMSKSFINKCALFKEKVNNDVYITPIAKYNDNNVIVTIPISSETNLNNYKRDSISHQNDYSNIDFNLDVDKSRHIDQESNKHMKNQKRRKVERYPPNQPNNKSKNELLILEDNKNLISSANIIDNNCDSKNSSYDKSQNDKNDDKNEIIEDAKPHANSCIVYFANKNEIKHKKVTNLNDKKENENNNEPYSINIIKADQNKQPITNNFININTIEKGKDNDNKIKNKAIQLNNINNEKNKCDSNLSSKNNYINNIYLKIAKKDNIKCSCIIF